MVIVVAVFAIMAAVVAAIEEDRSEPEWRVPSPSPTSPVVSGIGNIATMAPVATTKAVRTATQPAPRQTYFRNCADAKAAGVAPMRRGDPGYRSGLDRDGDGIACDS